MRPDEVNILGIVYSIEYMDKPSEVDIFKRASLWGQIDYWTRSIRIYDNGRPNGEIWQTLVHEILHGLANALKLKALEGDDNDDAVDLLATGIADVLFRNGWLSRE